MAGVVASKNLEGSEIEVVVVVVVVQGLMMGSGTLNSVSFFWAF